MYTRAENARRRSTEISYKESRRLARGTRTCMACTIGFVGLIHTWRGTSSCCYLEKGKGQTINRHAGRSDSQTGVIRYYGVATFCQMDDVVIDIGVAGSVKRKDVTNTKSRESRAISTTVTW